MTVGPTCASQASGGVLRSKHETYAAAERMIGTLGDRWSAFLPPSAFRRALRKPQPAERDYLAAYVRCRRPDLLDPDWRSSRLYCIHTSSDGSIVAVASRLGDMLKLRTSLTWKPIVEGARLLSGLRRP